MKQFIRKPSWILSCLLFCACSTTKNNDCNQSVNQLEPIPSVKEQLKLLESKGIVLLEKRNPNYPISELRSRNSGAVLIKATINKFGVVASTSDIVVEKSIGSELFVVESKKALMQWRWDVSKAQLDSLPTSFQAIFSFCVK
jgi:outer membrane biosynthesis protein TonB